MPADAARCAITGSARRSGRPLMIDLFAGVGMWSLGMERAGFAAVAACEIDPWKRAVYARHFPRARLYDDARELTGTQLRADGIVPAVVVGSPPCKEYSAANGKGRGIEGDGLFLEFVRLVAELGPRWACAENSPRIRTKGFDRIAREFESAGYACRAYVLGADDLRAPHIRKRAWIVANRADAIGPGISGDGRRAPSRAPRGMQGEASQWQRIWSDAGELANAFRDAPVAAREQVGRAGQSWQDGGASANAAFATGAALASWYVADGGARPARSGFVERGVAALERAIGARGLEWNGGPGRYLSMVDELAGGMARRVAAAAGDSILPTIAEIIGRSLIAIDPSLCQWSAA